jgi:hypothetical protein
MIARAPWPYTVSLQTVCHVQALQPIEGTGEVWNADSRCPAQMWASSRFWQQPLGDQDWIQGWRKAKWVERLLRASCSWTESHSMSSRAISSWFPPRLDSLPLPTTLAAHRLRQMEFAKDRFA